MPYSHGPMKSAMTVGASITGIAVGGTVYTITGSILTAAKAVGAIGGLALLVLIVLETLAFLYY